MPAILPFLLLPIRVNLSFGSAALLIPLLYFIAYQIGRDSGKNKESKLWQKWGGAPTTRFLRHSNTEFDAVKRNAVHEKLSSLRIEVPSAEAELADPVSADARYEYCTYEIIRRTRNQEAFPLVFQSLISYGLQRNLFGLKWVGTGVCLLSVVVCVMIAIMNRTPLEELAPSALTILVNVVVLSIWLVKVTERKVRMEAEKYAYNLLEAALNLSDSPATQAQGQ